MQPWLLEEVFGVKGSDPEPVFFSFPHLTQGGTQFTSDARPFFLGSLDPLMYPLFGLFPAFGLLEGVDQTEITSCFFCLALAEGDNLFMPAGILQCLDKPVAQVVAAVAAGKTVLALCRFVLLQALREFLCHDIPVRSWVILLPEGFCATAQLVLVVKFCIYGPEHLFGRRKGGLRKRAKGEVHTGGDFFRRFSLVVGSLHPSCSRLQQLFSQTHDFIRMPHSQERFQALSYPRVVPAGAATTPVIIPVRFAVEFVDLLSHSFDQLFYRS